MKSILALLVPLKILVLGSLKQLFTRLKYLVTFTKPPLGASGLTILCPIISSGNNDPKSTSMLLRYHLQNMPLHDKSPMAAVPNTYLCRFYVLNDVFYQGAPAVEEHLQSKYLVFSTNYYGDLNTYLEGMWKQGGQPVRDIFQYCINFNQVNNATEFVKYIKKCQVKNSLFFNGSSTLPLDEQLKNLYLKQEFSLFAYENQGKSPEDLQQAFQAFIARTQPNDISTPTWTAGSENQTIKQ